MIFFTLGVALSFCIDVPLHITIAYYYCLAAHKMKNLIDEQTSLNVAQKKIDSLEQEARQLRQECERTKADLLAELKQTRAEKQTFEMMAQRLSEKQTKQRMQQQPQTDDKQPIGNFISHPNLTCRSKFKETLLPYRKAVIDYVPKSLRCIIVRMSHYLCR